MVQPGVVMVPRRRHVRWDMLLLPCLLVGASCAPVVDDGGAPLEPAPPAPRLDREVLTAAPEGRAFAGAAILDGRLYLVGGGGGTGFEPTPVVDVYDLEGDAWSTVAPLPSPRSGVSALASGGRLYVIGGIVGGSERSDRVDIYDPATDTWSEGAPLPAPRHEHAGVAHDGRLYVMGGFGGRSFDYENTLFIYDTASDVWNEGPPAPHQRHGGAGVVVDGRLWFVGGNDNDVALRIVDVFDPVAGTWEIADVALREGRFGAAAAAVDGGIVVVGGSVYGGPDVGTLYSSTVEVVDTAERWSSYLDDFDDPPLGHVAVSDGSAVYVIGGISQGCFCASSPVFRLRPAR